ncbi:MAG: ECF transporter S component [Lachnospiraceae bacterium]|nr:ECF transporter S component [Lachnospiraceae bacterium]
MSTGTTTVSNTKSSFSTKQIATIGICAAISFVLMFVKFPVAYLGFLELEISDLPAIFMTLVYGPVAGVFVELIKNILHLATTSTGMSGELANFAVSLGYVIPLGLIFHRGNGKRKLITGLGAGIIGMVIMGIIINYFVTVPLYLTLFGKDAVLGMVQAVIPSIHNVAGIVILGITPFNIFKGLVISILAYYLYKVLKDRIA